MKLRRSLAVGLGVVALAVPTAAAARPGKGKAKGHSKSHPVMYVFKGAYAGESSVDVARGNAHVRGAGLVGQTVQFDLSSARLVVGDTNGDQVVDLSDVATGDAVVVKARLPRRSPVTSPVAARQLVDQTNPPSDESEGDGTGDEPTIEDSGTVPELG
jgi:hypothetical protein